MYHVASTKGKSYTSFKRLTDPLPYIRTCVHWVMLGGGAFLRVLAQLYASLTIVHGKWVFFADSACSAHRCTPSLATLVGVHVYLYVGDVSVAYSLHM